MNQQVDPKVIRSVLSETLVNELSQIQNGTRKLDNVLIGILVRLSTLEFYTIYSPQSIDFIQTNINESQITQDLFLSFIFTCRANLELAGISLSDIERNINATFKNFETTIMDKTLISIVKNKKVKNDFVVIMVILLQLHKKELAVIIANHHNTTK